MSMKDDLLIIDTQSHGPLVWNDTLIGSCDEMLDSGIDPLTVAQKLLIQIANMAASDPDYFQQYVQAWKECGVTCVSWPMTFGSPLDVYLVYACVTHIIDNRRDFFVKVVKAADIERAHSEGKKGIIFNVQDLTFIGLDIDLLDRLYQMGLRIMQLTHNLPNQVGCGCIEPVDSGLTDFGRSVVERMNNLGVLVDISHCGPRTSMDAVLHSKAPVICSHSTAKTIRDHVRGKDDELLKAVAERGGFIGITAIIPAFLTEKPTATVDDFLDHVDHVVKIAGLDHVGLGTDFCGFSLPDRLAAAWDELIVSMFRFKDENEASFTKKTEGFEDYARFPNLIAGLMKRGYSDGEVQKLAGQNFLKLFREVVG
jgi:membrane dipeptidase